MTMTLDGTAGITFPSGSGTQAAQSKVLQVVQGSLASQTSTSSTSYVTSGLTASITPLFSTSKILIMVNGGKTYASNDKIISNMYKNGTTLGASATWVSIELNTVGGSANHSFCYLDSPASTSSTTYLAYFKSSGGSAVYFSDTPATYGQVTITLMEIAA